VTTDEFWDEGFENTTREEFLRLCAGLLTVGVLRISLFSADSYRTHSVNNSIEDG